MSLEEEIVERSLKVFKHLHSKLPFNKDCAYLELDTLSRCKIYIPTLLYHKVMDEQYYKDNEDLGKEKLQWQTLVNKAKI